MNPRAIFLYLNKELRGENYRTLLLVHLRYYLALYLTEAFWLKKSGCHLSNLSANITTHRNSDEHRNYYIINTLT